MTNPLKKLGSWLCVFGALAVFASSAAPLYELDMAQQTGTGLPVGWILEGIPNPAHPIAQARFEGRKTLCIPAGANPGTAKDGNLWLAAPEQASANPRVLFEIELALEETAAACMGGVYLYAKDKPLLTAFLGKGTLSLHYDNAGHAAGKIPQGAFFTLACYADFSKQSIAVFVDGEARGVHPFRTTVPSASSGLTLKFMKKADALASHVGRVLVSTWTDWPVSKVAPAAGKSSLPSRSFVNPGPYYVSPTGDDGGEGTKERPFQTLAMAQAAVRAAAPGMNKDLVVNLAAGEYRLRQTLTFAAADSGRNGHSVVWRSADGSGKARILGSRVVDGWQKRSGMLWKAQVEQGMVFHTLYQDGVRLRKARFPNHRAMPGFDSAAGDYLVSQNGSPEWQNKERTSWIVHGEDAQFPAAADPSTWRINIFPWGKCDWHRWTAKATAHDRAARRIEFDNEGDRTEMLGGARYFLEDDLAFLDAPGEFFLDVKTGTLYVIPLGGAAPGSARFTAPVLHTLVRVQGDGREAPVRHVRFEGLSLEETDALSPSLYWWRHDWGRKDHALLALTATEQIVVSNCRLRNSGRHGVLMVGHNVSNTVTGCLVEHVGISGLTLCNRFSEPGTKTATLDRLEHNRLCNNRVRFVGELGIYCSSVEIMSGSFNEVCHSELTDSPRYAFTMRGNTFSETASAKASRWDGSIPPAVGNSLHHLRVERMNQDSGDTGAIQACQVNIENGHCTNRFEQLTIVDSHAIPGMLDHAPNGIFFDWPAATMHQVLRHIQVVRSQDKPFRANGPDNETSALMENVSWKDGFDRSKMEYADIGVKPGFPAAYGGAPPAPRRLGAPSAVVATASSHASVDLAWNAPAGTAPATRAVYRVFRNGESVGETFETRFADRGLSEGTKYRYEVCAADGDFGPAGPRATAEIATPDDTVPPRALLARASADRKSIVVLFTKTVEPATDFRASLSPSVRLGRPRPGLASNALILECGELARGARYTLALEGLRDSGRRRNAMAPCSLPINVDGLLFRFTFDEAPPTTGTPDRSAAVWKGTARPEAAKGRDGMALRLDGREAWVEGPADLGPGAGDFTLAAWIWKEVDGNKIILSKGNDWKWPGQFSWGFEYPNKAGNVALRCNNRYFGGASNSVPARTWVHVAFVKQGTAGVSYVGGVPSGAPHDLSALAELANEHPYLIGRRPGGIENAPPIFFSGMLDDVGVWARALSAEEVRALASK